MIKANQNINKNFKYLLYKKEKSLLYIISFKKSRLIKKITTSDTPELINKAIGRIVIRNIAIFFILYFFKYIFFEKKFKQII